MRVIKADIITQTVKKLCIKAAHSLPADVQQSLQKAVAKERGLAAKILTLCITNAVVAQKNIVPLCQDTGTAVLFVAIGQDVCVEGNLTTAIADGVKLGYVQGYLRKSTVKDPLFARLNTQDNLPPVIHYSFVKGDKIKIYILLKGGGAENKSAITFLTPCANIKEVQDFVVNTVKAAGAAACPPFIIGIGIGGNFETCAQLAKFALTRKTGTNNKNAKYAALETDLLKKINQLGIGPQGLGGKTTALAVHIEQGPCHMASLPVAVNIGCHSSRHAQAVV